jgi:hypothetical protein
MMAIFAIWRIEANGIISGASRIAWSVIDNRDLPLYPRLLVDFAKLNRSTFAF